MVPHMTYWPGVAVAAGRRGSHCRLQRWEGAPSVSAAGSRAPGSAPASAGRAADP